MQPRLGYRFLDTGVLYRAVAWLALAARIDQAADPALVPTYPPGGRRQGRLRRVRVDGTTSPTSCTGPTSTASRAAWPGCPACARRSCPCSVTWPPAGASSWPAATSARSCCRTRTSSSVEASAEERARRRAAERGVASREARAILDDMRRRDEADSTRATAPLRVPEGAHVLASDGRTLEQTVAAVCGPRARRAGR